MKKTLIVIDMQNDFVKNKNVLGNDSAISIIPEIQNKIKEISTDKNNKIIFTRDTHSENYLNTHEGQYLPVPHCMKGSDGWNIISELTGITTDYTVIDKPTFGFMNWKDYIDEDSEIILVGVCTDICVMSNAIILRALYPESNITVIADCCSGVTPDTHNAALIAMASCHIDIE